MAKDEAAKADVEPARRSRVLTERDIEKAKAAPGERLILRCGKVPGHQVRVTGQAKTFAVWLRVGRGRTAAKLLWTIGQVGELSLAEARDRALKLRDEARQGIDPRKAAEQAAEQLEDEANRLTVAGLLEKFIDARARHLKPYTVDEYRRIAQRYVAASDLGARYVDSLKRFHVREHVDRIAAENGEGMARSVRRLIKTATAWATEEEYIENNPLAGLKHVRGNVRERVLSDDEAPRFWVATEALPIEVRSCLRLHLLLALRFPSESLMARWDEVDLRARTWTVPGSRRKGKAAEGGGRTLMLPLSTDATAILEELRAVTGKSGRVFGRLARRSGVDYWWRLKVRPAVGGAAITPHDLRRTCATRIVEMGFPWTVADAVLGHALKGSARPYIHAAPLPEMRRALDAWGRRLAELVNGEARQGADVVPLGRA